jgi:hypothetical protein
VSRLHAVKPSDRTFFAICGVAGALILLGCALPTFRLHLDAAVGAGESQQVFDYYRDLHLATYGEPGARVFMLAGIAFLAAGVLGTRRPAWWLVVAVAAVSLTAFVQTVRTVDYAERSSKSVGYLAPALEDFRAEVLRKPEARLPEYYGPGRGSIRKLAGWKLVGWSVAILSLVAWFRTLLLVVPSPKKAVLIYVPLLLVVAVTVIGWWLRDFHPS